MKIAQGPGQVVHRTEQEMLDGAGRSLDGGRTERRLPMGREEDAVHACGLRAAQEGADVVRILERIEDEDERRLATPGGARQDVVDRGEDAWLDHERDALVSVEAGQRRQRATLHLDDRDA
ncbi:MAG: hypothetical protein WKF78_06630 [Candidatus Limnocylindrales bacterium]